MQVSGPARISRAPAPREGAPPVLKDEYAAHDFVIICDIGPNRLTSIRLQPYSGGMISEFQDLSEKVDQLAELTHLLRRENAELRQTNAALQADNAQYAERMREAQQRVLALLEKIPELVQAGLAEASLEHRELQ